MTDTSLAKLKDISCQLPALLLGVSAATSRELWWMNQEWLELRWGCTIDQKLAAVCTDQCFGEACWHPSGTLRPYDGGNKHLRNVGQLLRDYTAPYSRKLSSTY